MKRFIFSFVFSVVLSLSFASVASAQSQSVRDANLGYTFDLPEPGWKMTLKPTETNPNVEFVHGDRMNGHFEIRKMSVKRGDMLSDVIRRDQEAKLQFLPGFVAGKEENFLGALRGKAFNYEFVRSGKNMSGRFYYLKADETTVYVLRFTGLRDQLRSIRNQVDSIARTFKVKAA